MSENLERGGDAGLPPEGSGPHPVWLRLRGLVGPTVKLLVPQLMAWVLRHWAGG